MVQFVKLPKFSLRLTKEIDTEIYLKNPATTRKVMKRKSPAQTPGRPNDGAATSKKIEETSPIRNCLTNIGS